MFADVCVLYVTQNVQNNLYGSKNMQRRVPAIILNENQQKQNHKSSMTTIKTNFSERNLLYSLQMKR